MLSGFSLITRLADGGTGAGTMCLVRQPVDDLSVAYSHGAYLLLHGHKAAESVKKGREMRASLSLGDEIVTIGGICGRVIRIKDDTVTILTADSKMVFLKTAIGSVTRSAADFEEETPKKPAKAEDKPAAEAEENGSADDASPDGQSADKKDKKKGLSKKKED